MSRKSKSFTLIEVVVVIGVLGIIMGGLLASMRQVVEGEILLKKMSAVEEETRFIMDAFAQDAEYSELHEDNKPASEDFFYAIKFNLTEKKSELGSDSTLESAYTYMPSDQGYNIKRSLTSTSDPSNPEITTITMNNTPLAEKPVYRVRLVNTPDGTNSYLITISLIFRVTVNDDEQILIPVETSAMSRTFEI
jgi:prepilin-type N-terminal cleavage/methylation domain-containing protein